MLERYQRDKKFLAATEQTLSQVAPPGSVIATLDETIEIELTFARKWKIAERALSLPLAVNDKLDGVGAGADLSFQRFKRRALLDRYAGRSMPSRDSLFAADLLQWAKGKPVFVIAPTSELDSATSELTARNRFAVVSVIDPEHPGVITPETPGRRSVAIARWHIEPAGAIP